MTTPAYRTGFCGNGQHEGTSLRSPKGRDLLPCRGEYYIQGKEYVCGCECHVAFRQIAELTGVRAAHAAPKPRPAEPVLPAPVLAQPASSAPDLIGFFFGVAPNPLTTDPQLPATDEARRTAVLGAPPTPASGPVPAPRPAMSRLEQIAAQFKATQSGRRARGQLEAEVAHVMLRWFKSKTEPAPIDLTPDAVRVQIKSEPEPSVGAIHAIFVNWRAKGWVSLGDKPFRMKHPTQAGIQNLRRWE